MAKTSRITDRFKSKDDIRREMMAILNRKIREIGLDSITLKIPGLKTTNNRIKNARFHTYPEIFFQESGATHFQMPNESLQLNPGEVAIIPEHTSHTETTFNRKGIFYNFVIAAVSENLSFHFALQKNGTPYIATYMNISDPRMEKISGLLDEIILASRKNPEKRPKSTLMLLAAVFQIILEVCESHGVPEGENPHFLVKQCKYLVQFNLADRNLSVNTLAAWLGCSSNYLSHAFSLEEKMHLTEYINERRLAQSKNILKATTLPIKNTGLLCGFSDANYFIRRFRKRYGIAPKQFRKTL